MYHNYKDTQIYIMRHGGGWAYNYRPEYGYGQFSTGFETREECVKAAEEQIDGKRGKWGRKLDEN